MSSKEVQEGIDSEASPSEDTSATGLLMSESESEESSSDDEANSESLSTTILREIQEGTYACLICTSEIDYTSTVWSCPSCYRVYDLDCVKDWAKRGSSTDQINKTWRCPSCNDQIKNIPKVFSCWCGRVRNPGPNRTLPFSCGNTCSKKYDGCIHSCSSECHPGDHPLCGAMGPLMKCQCGESSRQLPCIVTPYKNGWRCEGDCNINLCELNHKCSRGCHSGFCGPCKEPIKVKCYCGSEELEMKCHEKILRECFNEQDKWIGGGACNQVTKKYYDCKIHFDEIECSDYKSETQICPMNPSVVSTCYCGKCEIRAPRITCTDPVPECDNVCGKKLACGCNCLQKCHPGECKCYSMKKVDCVCGFSSFTVPCKFLQSGNRPTCTHQCFALLSCRKHQHRMTCCPSEQVALRRERERKKAIRNNIRSNFDDEIMSIEPLHICTRICNKLKSCGQHYCDALCHSGPCGVCLESSNEDLVCNCGKTVIEAPVRCGTKISCDEQCVRQKSCGHRQEPHRCHSDDVSCPKCTAVVAKACKCGAKSDVPFVLCSQTNVICGIPCNEKKQCGHFCTRVCSPSCTRNNIHESSTLCQSPCKKFRTNCPHICQLKCHTNKVGRSKKCEATPCRIPVQISCNCGRLVQSIACNSSLESASNIGAHLECDQTCAQEKRNRDLSEAFEAGDGSSDVSRVYSDAVLSIYKSQEKWCSNIESFVLNFVEEGIELEDSKKFHVFAPMNKAQMFFIQELSKSYNLYSDLQEEGNKKHAYICINSETTIPRISIKDTIKQVAQLEEERKRRELMERDSLRGIQCNAILIQDVFMGITKQDLEADLINSNELPRVKEGVIAWMNQTHFIFYFPDSFKNTCHSNELELETLLKSFKGIIRENSLAFDCKLCLIDEAIESIMKIDSESAVLERLQSLVYEPKESSDDVSLKEEPQI